MFFFSVLVSFALLLLVVCWLFDDTFDLVWNEFLTLSWVGGWWGGGSYVVLVVKIFYILLWLHVCVREICFGHVGSRAPGILHNSNWYWNKEKSLFSLLLLFLENLYMILFSCLENYLIFIEWKYKWTLFLHK